MSSAKIGSENVILLVEDNPDDIDLTVRAFQRHNLQNQLVVVRDGEEALDYLFCRGAYQDREPSQPRVVLLDLKLPKVDGLEVLKQIRENEQTKFLPVVILTSSQEEQDLIQGYSLGANSYVRKPVDFAHFVDAARQLGLYWLLLNESLPQKYT